MSDCDQCYTGVLYARHSAECFLYFISESPNNCHSSPFPQRRSQLSHTVYSTQNVVGLGVWVSTGTHCKSGVVEHTCNPSRQKQEGQKIEAGQFETILLSYVKTVSKNGSRGSTGLEDRVSIFSGLVAVCLHAKTTLSELPYQSEGDIWRQVVTTDRKLRKQKMSTLL